MRFRFPLPSPRLSLLLVSAILASPASALQAQSPPCSNQTTDAGMRQCENARYTAADKQLQMTYHSLLSKVSPQARRKLTAAQAAWHQFSVANADFVQATATGGTLGPLLHITALADMTEARNAELTRMLQ